MIIIISCNVGPRPEVAAANGAGSPKAGVPGLPRVPEPPPDPTQLALDALQESRLRAASFSREESAVSEGSIHSCGVRDEAGLSGNVHVLCSSPSVAS